MNDEVVNEIKTTKQYDKFKLLKGNRELRESHVKELMKSMERIGFLDIPILVNNDFIVIEGQHRLEAAKRLQLPVKYTVQVDKKIGLNECQALNSCSKNWSMKDYIDSYATQENQSYVYLKNIMNLYPTAPMSMIAAALYNHDRFNINTIKNGNVVIDKERMERACKILHWACPIMDQFDNNSFKGPKIYVQICICMCYSYFIDGLDISLDRLHTVVEETLIRGGIWCNTDTCMQVIEECYNYDMLKDKRVLFYNIYREQKLKNM